VGVADGGGVQVINSVGVWVAVLVEVAGSGVLVGRSVRVGLRVPVAVAVRVGEAVSAWSGWVTCVSAIWTIAQPTQ
jgi:hypothetical protein